MCIRDRVCKVPGRGEKRYLLQRINTGIFKDPDGLMENIIGVTDYLRRLILEQGLSLIHI